MTVQNNTVRDLDVGTKVAPVIGQLSDEVHGFVRALPLFGVALSAGVLIILAGYGIASRKSLLLWIAPNVFLAELLATSIRIAFVILGPPILIITDKLGSYRKAIRRLQRDGHLSENVTHRTSKYLNNIVEADHGALKAADPAGARLPDDENRLRGHQRF